MVEIMSGELTPLATVINEQINSNKEILYGPAYSNRVISYKSEMVRRIKPEVLALGNSKILTIRKEFFKTNTIFYNAGSTAASIEAFKMFVESTGVYPKVIIMTVEPLHFNPSLKIDKAKVAEDLKYVSPFSEILNAVGKPWLGVYRDYIQKKFTLKALFAKNSGEKIGLNALINNSGMRNDGSFHYGNQYVGDQSHIDKINDAVNFITHRQSAPSDEIISKEALSELDTFLKFCKEHNIYVIGYTPPAPHVIYEAYKEFPSYGYMFKTYEDTKPIFKKNNFSIFDFFDMATFGAPDFESLDGYHTDEKTTLRIIIKMAESDKTLRNYVDPKYLQGVLNSAKDRNDII